jgi:AcrR family transcriptional regulator
MRGTKTQTTHENPHSQKHAKQAPNDAETRLLQSGLRLFAECGYDGVSIREIIEGAGVTRPVLYYYFQNKEDLFRRLVELKFSEFLDRIRNIIRHYASAKERLTEVLATAFELAEQNLDAVRLILQVFFAPSAQLTTVDRLKLARQRFRLIEQIMDEGIQRGELSGGDAASLALVFIGILDIHIMAKANQPELHLRREHAEGLAQFFMNGARPGDVVQKYLQNPFTSG